MKIFLYEKPILQKDVPPPVYTVEDYCYFFGNKAGLWREECVGIKNAMRRAHALATNGRSVSVMDGTYTVTRFLQDIDTRFVWYPVNQPLRRATYSIKSSRSTETRP
jgi:hypothetical protein